MWLWNLLRPPAIFAVGLVLGLVIGGWEISAAMSSHERYGYERGAADGYNRGRDWAEEERDGRRIVGVAPEHIDSWNVPWPYPGP